MAVADAHPGIEELAAFTLGTLDEETHAAVEAHVTACTSCQQRATVVAGDPFLDLLRSAHAHLRGGPDSVAEAGQAPTPAPLAAVSQAITLPPGPEPSAAG